MGRYTNDELDLSALEASIGNMSGLVAPAGYSVYGAGMYRIFAEGGTFTVPAGVTRVRTRVIGGGGGGARRTTSGAGALGGGGGGYVMQECDVVPGQVIPVTVGAPGVGATTAGAPGTDGGTSSFGSYCTATGGTGGSATTIDPGVGGDGISSNGGFTASGGRGGTTNDSTNYGSITGGGAPGSQIGDGGRGGDVTRSGATGSVATGGGACGNQHGGDGIDANIGNVYTGGAGVGGPADTVVAADTSNCGLGGPDTLGVQAAVQTSAPALDTSIIIPRFISDIICGGGASGSVSGIITMGTLCGGGAGLSTSTTTAYVQTIMGGAGANASGVGGSPLIGGGGGGGLSGGGNGGRGLVIVEW